MNLINRIQRFFNKNAGGLWLALFIEFCARLYTVPVIRGIARNFWQTRKPKKWIFLVGCYNSGTTILREILGAHPAISCLPKEGVRFTSHLPQPEDLGWTRMWFMCQEYMKIPLSHDARIAGEIVKDWAPWWDRKADFFLEKSITNVTRMDWLDRHFSPSIFIGITRNGYCVSEGIRRRAKPEKDIAALYPEGYSIDLAAEQWVLANKLLTENIGKVENFMLVRYEDFIDRPVENLKKIWKAIGVEEIDVAIQNGYLRVGERKFYLIDGNVNSFSRLRDEDKQSIKSIIEKTQTELGYELL